MAYGSRLATRDRESGAVPGRGLFIQPTTCHEFGFPPIDNTSRGKAALQEDICPSQVQQRVDFLEPGDAR